MLQDEETTMTWTAHTATGRGRLRLALAGAVLLTVLVVSTGAMAASTEVEPAGGPTLLGATTSTDTKPRSLTPGFLLDLDRGRFTTFDAPQARVGTVPYDINNRGQIVGRYDDGRSEQAFLRDARGRFTTLRIPGARSAWASGINDRGQVVGDYLDPRGSGTGLGFAWDRGRFTTIKPPGAATTTAQSINDRGQIVGTFSSDLASGTIRGFLLDRGRYASFGVPGAPVTIPGGINDRGQISGLSLAPSEVDPVAGGRGFLLARGVNGAVRPVNVPGAPRTFATGLNDRGQLVGAYENPDAAAGPQDGGSPPMDMPGLLEPAG
jgi:hypothetical protein